MHQCLYELRTVELNDVVIWARQLAQSGHVEEAVTACLSWRTPPTSLAGSAETLLLRSEYEDARAITGDYWHKIEREWKDEFDSPFRKPDASASAASVSS